MRPYGWRECGWKREKNSPERVPRPGLRPDGAMKAPRGILRLPGLRSLRITAASVSRRRVSGSCGKTAPGYESRVCGGLDFAPPKGFSLDPANSFL
jgi:hypothetical protein